MKKGLSEILCVIDKSGSMSGLEKDTVGGFNSFIKEQKKIEGGANVSVALFSSVGAYDLIYDNVDLDVVKEMTLDDYVTSGLTALYDAIALMMETTGRRLAKLPEDERPEHVIVAIITDGDENNSKDHTHDKISEMIKLQKDTYNWKFVFLAANIDAKGVASGLNIGADNAFQYQATSKGVQASYGNMARACTSLRSGATNAFDDVHDMKVTMEDTSNTNNDTEADA